MDIISGAVSLISSIFGGGKKKTKAALKALDQKVNVLAAENAEQSKLIKYLLFGFAGLAVIIFFFVFLKRRRG